MVIGGNYKATCYKCGEKDSVRLSDAIPFYTVFLEWGAIFVPAILVCTFIIFPLLCVIHSNHATDFCFIENSGNVYKLMAHVPWGTDKEQGFSANPSDLIDLAKKENCRLLK